jgi:hypothetical protein
MNNHTVNNRTTFDMTIRGHAIRVTAWDDDGGAESTVDFDLASADGALSQDLVYELLDYDGVGEMVQIAACKAVDRAAGRA